MKIFILGATGTTGKCVVELALAQGHQVVALVRQADRVAVRHANLEVRQGSPTCIASVLQCIQGVDAVIHCLGIGGKGDGSPTTLVSDSVKVVLEAMKQRAVRRIVCMSNVGAGGSGTWLANRLVIPLFLRWLQPIIEDKNRMEAALQSSDTEWISVRLPNIIEGPLRSIRISHDGRRIGLSITARSVATFLLDRACTTNFVRESPCISN
jgi:uncharacterized protein YbjT (DUF2867 family)